MAEIRIRLLGGFELSGHAGRAASLSGAKARAMLAVLARHPGRTVPRAALAGMLWPDSDECSARANLRQALKFARRALDGPRRSTILGRDGTLCLARDVDEVDVARFERDHASEALDTLRHTARLYRGELLEGHDVVDGPFWEWLTIERAHLHELAVSVHSRLLTRYREDDDPDAAIDTAVRLLAIEPLLEDVHRQLIEMYVAAGRPGMARAQYQRCRGLLRRELGIEPEPATRRLARSSGRPTSPVTCAEPSGEDGDRPGRGARPARVDDFLSHPAVAVLPFESAGGGPVRDDFANGLCDDIVTALGHWRSFPVIASASTCRIGTRADDDPVESLGPEVRYLVTGTVRTASGRRRVTMRLLERESGQMLWGERFDIDPGDLFAVEDELARKIGAMTAYELERAEHARVERRRPDDLNAWEHVVLGTALLQRCTGQDNAHARSSFERALASDPDYGDALSGLAFGHLRDLFSLCADERQRPLREGERAALRAVALDCNSSVAHHALATAHVWAGRDETTMLRETELAVELNPSNAGARMALGNRLDLVGRSAEGIVEMVSSLELNPRDPRRFVCMGFLARAHLSIGDHETALDWARQAVRLRPDLPDPSFRLALCLAHLGQVREARAALQGCERSSPGSLARLASWQPYADAERSERVLEGLRRHGLSAETVLR